MKSVFLKAEKPVNMMEKMSMKTKMTPKEPTFMKMLKSFFKQRMERATKSITAQ